MRNWLPLCLIAIAPLTALANPAAEAFQTNCQVCHAVSGKPTIAPPIFAVKSHVLKHASSREAFVERVVNWVAAPDQNNATMPGAIRKFGLMPALALDPTVVKQIAEYLYDTDMQQPDWYKKHYREEHGEEPAK